jgi:hypothetical protein
MRLASGATPSCSVSQSFSERRQARLRPGALCAALLKVLPAWPAHVTPAAPQLYGLLVAAPSAHYWQATLEQLFPNKADPLRAVKKVLLDQVTYGPVANLTFFRCTILSMHLGHAPSVAYCTASAGCLPGSCPTMYASRSCCCLASEHKIVGIQRLNLQCTRVGLLRLACAHSIACCPWFHPSTQTCWQLLTAARILPAPAAL